MAKTAGSHGPKGDGQLLAQAAHFAQVLFAGERMNHGTRSKEEKRALVRRRCVMRWKMAAGIGGYSAAEEHVAQLRDGGVGEDALDVVLNRGRWWRRRKCGGQRQR